MATTKQKMTIQKYIEAYRKYVDYYNEMAKDVDFELLKNIDILDCSKITKTEKDEIEKFTKKIQNLDESLKGDVNAYKAVYEFKDDDKFEFCRNIVKPIYGLYIQHNTTNGFTVFYEGILEFMKKKYNLRSDIYKYNLFSLGIILKDVYVSNIELLQNFIKFLNEVIIKKMTNDNITEIKPTDTTAKHFILNVVKNLLIKDNHKHILDVYDDSNYKNDSEAFFNRIIKSLESKIDKPLFDILKDKYYRLFNIKYKMTVYMYKTIRYFHESTFQDDLFEKECANLFKLPPYQINKGNKALFEEFLYTIASLINLFYTNVDLKPFKDVNLLTIASFTDTSLFDKYQFIYNVFLPFIEEEKKFYTEVQTYVTSNAASFDTIKLTEVKNVKNQKDYSYIEYILESLDFVKEMFIGIMNILYTMSAGRLNSHKNDTIKFLNTLINKIPFIFDMLKFLTFEMYEIIIFQENKSLSFNLIKNYKYFSYYDEQSNKYVEIINSQDYFDKVTKFIKDVNQDSSFSKDQKTFLTYGYDIKDDDTNPVVSTDPNYYGIVGFYFFTIELNNFYNIIVENIDNFKNDTVGFKYGSKTYNFQGFLNEYKTIYIDKNRKTATTSLDKFKKIYNQNDTPSVQTKKPTTQSATIKSASSNPSLLSTPSSSKSLSSSTKPDSSSSLLSKSATQTPSVSSTSKPVKKPDSQKLDSSHASSPFGDYQGSSGDELKDKLYYLHQKLGLLSQRLDQYKISDNSQSYLTRLHKITDYRTFKTQTDREPQDFIAQIKLKNIGGKQNIGKYKYITEDSLGKAVNSNKARELANNYNQLTDKMIETEKKIGGIQKLALNDLNKSESGYIRMRGGEQQTNDYNNLIKQYQLMAIKQNNIINEIKNIKNIY